jgi:hypothetical protein
MATHSSNLAWPVKYRWQGVFSYKLKESGHNWFYDDPDNWLICEQTKDGQIVQEPKPLKAIADSIFTLGERGGIPEPHWQQTDGSFALLKWLREGTKRAVRSGLSVVLNAIVANSTLGPFSLLSNIAGQYVTVHIQGLKELEPAWFYFENSMTSPYLDEFMMAVPDQFFDKSGDIVSNVRADFKDRVAEFEFVRTLHQFNVIGFTVTSNESEIILKLRSESQISRYEKGRHCGCIPIPGKERRKGDEPEVVRTPEVVVQSAPVRQALKHLSRIWQDRNLKKSVLISAPPGSGKEAFCNSITYGNGRPTKNFCSLSMATDDQKDLERQLLGFVNQGLHHPGLILKAAKSGLFLDEVHQPEHPQHQNNSAARASLLRVLEAGDYLPKGSTTIEKVEDVLFIMATSKTPDELQAFNPTDFWTRMTHVVVMKHPLDLADGVTQATQDSTKKVLSKFFNFVWWENLESFFDPPPDSKSKRQAYAQALLDWQRDALKAVVVSGWVDNQDQKPADIFADALLKALAEQVNPVPIYKFSIRGLRNIATRLFFMAATRVSQGESVLPVPDDFRQEVLTVSREIVPMANLTKPPRLPIAKDVSLPLVPASDDAAVMI